MSMQACVPADVSSKTTYNQSCVIVMLYLYFFNMTISPNLVLSLFTHALIYHNMHLREAIYLIFFYPYTV